MSLLFQHVAAYLTIPSVSAIMLVRSGAVMVDGIQRTDPVLKIDKPCTLRIGNQRVWVSPVRRPVYDTKQEPISEQD